MRAAATWDVTGWGALRLSSRAERALIAGVILLSVAVLAVMFLRMLRRDLFIDTEAYYAAAMNVRDGDRFYERAIAWRDGQWSFSGPHKVPPEAGMDYSYPPLLALVFVPLTFLPLGVVSVLWLMFGFASLIGAVYLLTRHLLPFRGGRQMALVLGLSAVFVAYQPIRFSLKYGNVDCLLLLLVSLSLSAFLARRDTRAGGWLAAAVAVKPMLGLLILFFLWKRSYRAAAVFVVCATVAVFAPFAVVGFSAFADMVAAGSYFSSAQFAAHPINQSLLGFFRRFFTVTYDSQPIIEAPVLVSVSHVIAVCGILVMLSLATSRERLAPRAPLVLEFGLFIMAALYISPLTEDIHHTQLVIPLIALGCLLMSSQDSRMTKLGMAGLLLVLAYYSAVPYLTVMPAASYRGPWRDAIWVLANSPQLYGLVALTMIALGCVRRHRREAANREVTMLAPSVGESRSA